MSDFDIRSETLSNRSYHSLVYRRIRTVGDDNAGGCITGAVHTPWGTVDVNAEWAVTGIRHSAFFMAYKGRRYRTILREWYQRPYLVTLATRFAKQVTQEEEIP